MEKQNHIKDSGHAAQTGTNSTGCSPRRKRPATMTRTRSLPISYNIPSTPPGSPTNSMVPLSHPFEYRNPVPEWILNRQSRFFCRMSPEGITSYVLQARHERPTNHYSSIVRRQRGIASPLRPLREVLQSFLVDPFTLPPERIFRVSSAMELALQYLEPPIQASSIDIELDGPLSPIPPPSDSLPQTPIEPPPRITPTPLHHPTPVPTPPPPPNFPLIPEAELSDAPDIVYTITISPADARRAREIRGAAVHARWTVEQPLREAAWARQPDPSRKRAEEPEADSMHGLGVRIVVVEGVGQARAGAAE